MKWFKHDTTALHDAKIEKLVMKYGIEGYGVYFACIEMIAHDISKTNITFELEHDAELLAHKFKIDTIKLEEIMLYCIHLGLFGQSEVNGRLTCMKLATRIDDSMVKNPEMKKVQSQVKEKIRLEEDKKLVIEGITDISMKINENQENSEQTRLDKIRLEDKRKEKKTTEKSQCYLDIEKKFLSYYEKMIGHQYTADRRLYDTQLKRLSKKIEAIPNYLSLIDKKLSDMYNMSIKSSYWNLDLYAFCDRFDKIVDNSQKTKPTEINNIFAK